MQEYFNLDIQDNFTLNSPQEINNNNKQAALLSSQYIENNKNIGQIMVMTPPLRCSRVRVWPGKNDKYSKCVIELETTDNEWRFKQFLTDLGDKCRYLLTENSKKWFKYTFSASAMRDTYVNMFLDKNYKHNEPEKIQIQLSKLLLTDLNKKTANSYRNQYLVLRIVFKGVLVSDGVFSEVWRADQIFKARPNIDDSSESEYDDQKYEDIGESLSFQNKENVDNNLDIKEIKSENNKKEITLLQVEKIPENNKKEITLLQVEKIPDNNKINTENENKIIKTNKIKEADKNILDNENNTSKLLILNQPKQDNKEVFENKISSLQKNKVENIEIKEIKNIKKSQKKQRRKKIIISNNRKRNL